jgi:hypothetical protein
MLMLLPGCACRKERDEDCGQRRRTAKEERLLPGTATNAIMWRIGFGPRCVSLASDQLATSAAHRKYDVSCAGHNGRTIRT